MLRTGDKLPLPVRRPIQRVANAALKRVDWPITGRSRYGFTLHGSSADVIPRHVAVYGVWEPDISAWAGGFINAGDTVLDIGANLGYFSLLCASRGADVTAVEASPSNYAALTRNVAANRLDVQTVNAIAADEPGRGSIYTPAANHGDATTVPTAGMRHEGDVDRVVVDELLDGNVPRLVKIDTEGDELNVLRGLSHTLSRLDAGAAVLVEVSPGLLAQRNQTVSEVFDLMTGFEPFWLPNDYTPARYSDPTVAEPAPLTAMPTTPTDVVFVKQ